MNWECWVTSVCWLVPWAALPPAVAQEQMTAAEKKAYSQQMITAYLAREARRLDSQFLQGITSRQQWDALQRVLRVQYLEMLGLWPLPERTPLQATVTGVLEVDGVRIEKLHFQSMPRLYVTANFYLPAKVEKKLPAILYLCGHSDRKRDGNKTAYQHHGLWFAKNGYACLILDTLQLGEIPGVHHGTYRHQRWWWHAWGYSPAAVECWNGVRALDYLCSRPEVDPDRIGGTGRSGGGAAILWVAAADERLKVVVPVSGMSDLEDYVGQRVVNGHCDCMFLFNTYRWPWTYVAALVAPRPLLFLNSGHDPIFPMDGNERIRRRLEQLYRLYTERPQELFDVGTVPGGHEDEPELRLMAYRWMNRHLKGTNEPVVEGPLPSISGEQLRAFPEELPADALNGRIDELFSAPRCLPLPTDAASFARWSGELRQLLRRYVLRDDPPVATAEPEPLLDFSPFSALLQTEPGIVVEVSYRPPQKGCSSGWIVVAESDEGRNGPWPGWVDELAKEGQALLLVVPRGAGAWRWEDPPPYYIRRSFPLLGRTVESTQTMDVASVAQWVLRSSGPVQSWGIAGRGPAGVLGAYVALLVPEVQEVYLREPPSSHREGPMLPNVLRFCDLPEALGLLAPRPLTIVTPRPASFQPTRTIYGALGAEGQLTIQPSQPDSRS
jgi:dienelactone hydrolase